MGKFYPAHFYIHNLFIEVECHGPTKILASGSKIEFKEVWSIKKENLYERKL
jgi:hypothetical protein